MARMLTESQAWQKIADDIETKRRMPHGDGLCHECECMRFADYLIDDDVFDDMDGRIDVDLGDDLYFGCNHFPTDTLKAEEDWWAPRLMLAQIYALEAAEEGR